MDLTKITTPFGLLDEATQEALKAHGGPYECFRQEGGLYAWGAPVGGITTDSHQAIAWRVKPAPPKPREWWAVQIGYMHVGMWPDRKDAEGAASEYSIGAEVIHVREVLE